MVGVLNHFAHTRGREDTWNNISRIEIRIINVKLRNQHHIGTQIAHPFHLTTILSLFSHAKTGMYGIVVLRNSGFVIKLL